MLYFFLIIMIVYSFQYLDGICSRDYEEQNVNIYSLSSLDKLVEDYHQYIKDNNGNLEMFFEDYDNNPDYTYDNYTEAYREMIQHPKFKMLDSKEKEEILEFIPMPLSVEKILSFNLSPGQIKELVNYQNLILICHQLIETDNKNINQVYSVQTESQVQLKDYHYLFNDNLYSSLDRAIDKFNQQLLDDFEKNREFYHYELKIDIPKFLNYQDAYKFLVDNNLDGPLYKPLSIDKIETEKLSQDIVFKACHDEFGGYWVSLVSHKLIN